MHISPRLRQLKVPLLETARSQIRNQEMHKDHNALGCCCLHSV